MLALAIERMSTGNKRNNDDDDDDGSNSIKRNSSNLPLRLRINGRTTMIRQPGGQEKKSQRGGRDASQRRTRKKSSKSNNRSKAKNNGATPNSSPFQPNRPSLGGSPHVPRALSYNNEISADQNQNRNSRRRLQLQTRRHFTIITSECL